MQRKYVTKKLVARISNLTNGLFKQSLIEVMDCPNATDEQITDFMSVIRRVNWLNTFGDEFGHDLEETLKKKELIDELYLSKMMMLNTKDLNDILFLHEHSKPKRAQRTLEAIHSELARRSLLNDSSQSDAIYSNGDVDVKRKSKSTGKTTPKKKCEANKDRQME